MPPHSATGAILAEPTTEIKPVVKNQPKKVIVWRNVILFIYLHAAALYGVYLAFTSAKILTSLLAYILYVFGGLGITAGAHRLWSHKSYKATTPLRIILMVFNTLAFQNSIYEWARDHRVHHKYSETDADPHNAMRGMFFSHIGWLLVKKHPDVLTKGKSVDFTDMDKDPIVVFQKKYYVLLMPLICFVIPTCIPVYLWGETWSNAWFVSTLLRYAFTLHVTWFVNSLAHFYGSKPYDKFINPAQNWAVSAMALGEGWHNYHHTFPWDYKTAELGHYSTNFTTLFIDIFAKIGWAYDLKSVSPALIAKRAARTGDGSHVPAEIKPNEPPVLPPHELDQEGTVWGWDDRDMPSEDKLQARIESPAAKEE